jgi:hypothetical protein
LAAKPWFTKLVQGPAPRCTSLRKRPIITAIAALAMAAPAAAADSITAAIDRIETGWAQANFVRNDKVAQVAAFDRLIATTAEIEKQAPGRAESIVWRRVLMTAKAGVARGFAGFRLVSDARRELERAQAIAPNPETGWGSSSSAGFTIRCPGHRSPLATATRRGPICCARWRSIRGGPAANLAYGAFHVEGGRFAEAEPVLQRALAAAADTAHPVADKGQRAEVEALMKTVSARLDRNR